MSPYAVNHLNLIISLLFILCAPSKALNPDDLRPPDDLMYVFERPPMYGTKQEFATFFSNQKKKILEDPDLTNRLYDLLWPAVEAGREDLYQPILGALRIRADLSPDQLKMITQKVREMATPSVVNTSSTERYFVGSAASMLSAYPSPAHEELLLSLLDMGDENWSWAAGMSLAKIGSRRSIEPLRRLVEERAARVGPEVLDENQRPKKDSLALALSRLERRVVTLERKSSHHKPQGQSDLEPRKENSRTANPEYTAERGLFLVAIVGSMVVMISSILFFLKRRSHG